ncbi:MAG: MnhB domain-containing protein [Spirochaetales bacterium]
MIRTILVTAFVALVFAGVIILANAHPSAEFDVSAQQTDISDYILSNFQEQTGAENAVAAIYLNYRVYDTLFEALLLLIAIVGIIHFFRIGIRNDKLVAQRRTLAGAGRSISGGQEIVSRMTGFLYPFVILFGLYVIVNGHDTPGGGFQGGAILATLFIGRFIVKPVNDINAELLHDVEQALFVFILLIPIMFLFYQLNDQYPGLNEAFLILMNVLIGLKVCLGLTIVVFRFGFDEENL